MALKQFLVLCLAISSSLAIDYCSKDLKCQRTPHVACNNPLFEGGWGSECSDPELIEMTDEMKQGLVDMHNKYRNQQANGKTPHYDPATRMATMRWDDDLAKFAETNVRSCHYGHDPCQNTMNWIVAGQNIAKESMSGGFPLDANVESIVDLGSGWFESEHGNGGHWGWMKFINHFKLPSTTDPKKQIGHFTQVVTDDAFAVGCAAARFKEGSATSILLTCDYSRTNLDGAKVYVAGPTASDCKTGTNSQYPGLCSENEQYEAWYYV